MRRGAIQINNYFAKLLSGRANLLSPPRSNKVFRALESNGANIGSMPISGAAEELSSAWQLGILTDARDKSASVTWVIDGQRLSDISGDGLPQAAEQLAVALAIASEGLKANDYVLEVSGTTEAAYYADVFSTTYNAILARELGVPSDLLGHEQLRLPARKSMNAAMRARVQEANELAESHGIRRTHKLQHEGVQVVKEVISEPQHKTLQPKSTDELTVWRHVQQGGHYKLNWHVELIEGQPMHIVCSVEYATESQRAVIETYTQIANRQLGHAGPRGVAELGVGVQSGYFDQASPIDEFTTVFATTFLTPAEQTQIGLKNHEFVDQTDLLQSIESVACERCGKPVQRFGSYGICLHCGDAQKVKN